MFEMLALAAAKPKEMLSYPSAGLDEQEADQLV